MYSFLGLLTLGSPPISEQSRTHLQHCFRFKSGRGSKADKRLVDRCRQNEDSGYVKAKGQGSIAPFFYSSPKSFPQGPFMTVPVLGCPSFEESYPSLANQSSARDQAG